MAETTDAEQTITQKIKHTLTFKIPTFLAWAVTRPFAHLIRMDYKSILIPMFGVTMYGAWISNRPITLSAGAAFLFLFLRSEYERGEWMHWHRERRNKKYSEETP